MLQRLAVLFALWAAVRGASLQPRADERSLSAAEVAAIGPEVTIDRKEYTVDALNRLYDEGRPSNDVAEAGLLIHQHDNTEVNGCLPPCDRDDYDGTAPMFEPGERRYFATSVINRGMPGLYNQECGLIIASEAAEVFCSYCAHRSDSNPSRGASATALTCCSLVVRQMRTWSAGNQGAIRRAICKRRDGTIHMRLRSRERRRTLPRSCKT